MVVLLSMVHIHPGETIVPADVTDFGSSAVTHLMNTFPGIMGTGVDMMTGVQRAMSLAQPSPAAGSTASGMQKVEYNTAQAAVSLKQLVAQMSELISIMEQSNSPINEPGDTNPNTKPPTTPKYWKWQVGEYSGLPSRGPVVTRGI